MSISRKILLFISFTASFVLSRYAPQYLFYASKWKTATILFLGLTVARFIYDVILWPKFLSPLRHLPQAPNSSLLMGQFRKILKEPTGMPQKEWSRTVPNDGIIRYMTAFNSERVLVLSPKALAEVLTQKSYEFIKPPQIQEGLARILGVGVLLAEGDEHKRQRKLLNPAFAYRHVKDLYPIFWGKSQEMVRSVDLEISQPSTSEPGQADDEKAPVPINVGATVSRATLDIIGLAGFERDFNAIADPSNKLYTIYQQVFNPTGTARILGIIGFFVPFWFVRMLPLKRNSDMTSASKYIRQTCMDMVQSKKAKLEKGEAVGVDVLSIALKSGGFKDEELVDQLMTFAAAGHETTASSMTWAIYLLCKHPTIQTRLRHALHSSPLFRSPTTHPATAETLDSIPYLTAVCNEVLRFYPPVPFTMRVAARANSTILSTPIPQNTTIILCPSATNFAPALWGPTADDFDPDRWIDDRTGLADNVGGCSSNYGFLTFLHGPRGCIGQGFAKAEFMCLVAAWVGGFETRLVDEGFVAEQVGGVTTRPKGGLRVFLKGVEPGGVARSWEGERPVQRVVGLGGKGGREDLVPTGAEKRFRTSKLTQ